MSKEILSLGREYQPLISRPPQAEQDMYRQACSADDITVKSWKHTWLENYRSIRDKYGGFENVTYGKLQGKNRHRPAIVIGAGPSVGRSLEALKESGDILSISCLHNYAYFEDNEWHPDYYLTLDAGAVVIDDMVEAGTKEREHYFETTKDKHLIACSFTDPRLLDLWQGEVSIFNCLIPNLEFQKELNAIERFSHYISSGGNALGASMYTAKVIMGSNPIMYVGADFCFSHDKKFHSWGSKYDDVGNAIRCFDVFGMPRYTWQSYYNFKIWFEYIACKVPGIWINCSDGILGAYRDGNISQFVYQELKEALVQYTMADVIYRHKINDKGEKIEEKTYKLSDYFSNTKHEDDLILF